MDTNQPTQFQDCIQATEAFEDLQMTMEDPRFANWLEITDNNYHTRLAAKYAIIRTQFDALMEEFYKIG